MQASIRFSFITGAHRIYGLYFVYHFRTRNKFSSAVGNWEMIITNNNIRTHILLEPPKFCRISTEDMYIFYYWGGTLLYVSWICIWKWQSFDTLPRGQMLFIYAHPNRNYCIIIIIMIYILMSGLRTPDFRLKAPCCIAIRKMSNQYTFVYAWIWHKCIFIYLMSY